MLPDPNQAPPMGPTGGAPAPAGPPPELDVSHLEGGPQDAASDQAQAGGGGDLISRMKQVKDLLDSIQSDEPDEQHSLLIEKMLTEAQQYLADNEKLNDTATGAGPGARLLRKAQGGAGGGGGGY